MFICVCVCVSVSLCAICLHSSGCGHFYVWHEALPRQAKGGRSIAIDHILQYPARVSLCACVWLVYACACLYVHLHACCQLLTFFVKTCLFINGNGEGKRCVRQCVGVCAFRRLHRVCRSHITSPTFCITFNSIFCICKTIINTR